MVVVTGGSGDIGRAICLQFAHQGYAVAFTYMRSYESARLLEDELQDLGIPVLSVKAQLANTADITALFNEVEKKYGRLDCLVNNAASGVQRSVNEITEKHWNWTHDVNVKAPWLCSVAAAKLMSAGGSIVGDKTASTQRVKASIPAPAVITEGNPSVRSGSQIAASGIKWALAKISFLPSFIIMTEPEETSLPVPEVVGIARRGAVLVIFSMPPSLTE